MCDVLLSPGSERHCGVFSSPRDTANVPARTHCVLGLVGASLLRYPRPVGNVLNTGWIDAEGGIGFLEGTTRVPTDAGERAV